MLPPRPPVIETAAEKGSVQSASNTHESGLRCPDLVSVQVAPSGTRSSPQSQENEADESAVAHRVGAYITADQEFNLGIRVVRKILVNAELTAVGAGKTRLDLTRPEWRELVALGQEDEHRPLPNLSADATKLVWNKMIDNAGGISRFLERLARDHLVVPGRDFSGTLHRGGANSHRARLKLSCALLTVR